MIAKFFDAKLRTGYKECTEEGLDALFDRTLVLFRWAPPSPLPLLSR